MNSGIYIITTPSSRLYVGSAVKFAHRWRVHLYNLRHRQHHSRALQSAYDKYGEAGLTFRKLLICAKPDLLFYEQRVIDSYPFSHLYNVAPVAGNQLGFKHSPETKAAYSAARRGVPRPRTVAHTQKIADARRGKKLSAAARANQSAAQKGRLKTPEHVAKVAALNRGKKRSPEVCAAMSKRSANRPRKATTSGFVGVSRKGNKWQARISVNGARKGLGYHDTAQAAGEAVQRAVAALSG